jgi:DivIVA domain-containing protein
MQQGVSMSLTLADVHNVAFGKPPRGQRGFDAEEVDAFLDEVRRELARLLQENDQLRVLLETAGGDGVAAPDMDSRPAARLAAVRTQRGQAVRDRAAAEQAVLAVHADLAQARSPNHPVGSDDGGAIPGVLAVANRTADACVADARREADELLSDAHAKAEQIARQARANADALERDARHRHQEAMIAVQARRTALQTHIRQLQQLLRDYHARLMANLHHQINDLDGRGQSQHPQTVAAVEAEARAP